MRRPRRSLKVQPMMASYERSRDESRRDRFMARHARGSRLHRRARTDQPLPVAVSATPTPAAAPAVVGIVAPAIDPLPPARIGVVSVAPESPTLLGARGASTTASPHGVGLPAIVAGAHRGKRGSLDGCANGEATTTGDSAVSTRGKKDECEGPETRFQCAGAEARVMPRHTRSRERNTQAQRRERRGADSTRDGASRR